jgi:pyruvate/2-oxoglutarate dehydrogenase complex dihydrolipoamide acyltransferase (E2) component
MDMSYEVDIVIPKFSDEIDDVQISNWLKSEGEFVDFGEPLVELEVNKSNVELDSPAAGTLVAVYCYEGEEVIVGERVGIIAVEEDDLVPDPPPKMAPGIDASIDDIDEEEDEDESLHDNLDNYDEENLV